MANTLEALRKYKTGQSNTGNTIEKLRAFKSGKPIESAQNDRKELLKEKQLAHKNNAVSQPQTAPLGNVADFRKLDEQSRNADKAVQNQKAVQEFVYEQGLKKLDDKYAGVNVLAKANSPEYQADVKELAQSTGHNTAPTERNTMYNPESTKSVLPYLGEKAKMGLMDFAAGLSNLNEIGKMDDTQKNLSPTQRLQVLQNKDKAEFQKAENENVSGGLKTVGNVVQATTAMIPNIMLSAANPTMGLAQVGLSAAGNSAQQATMDNATRGQALAYGGLSGAIEAGTEKLFGGLPFMKGIGDKVAGKLLDPIKNKVIKAGVKWAMNMGEEALEEGIAGALDPLAKRLTYDKDAKMATPAEIGQQMLMGAAVAGILGIPGTVIDSTGKQVPTVQAIKNVDDKGDITFTMADGSTLELNPSEMDKADLQKLDESLSNTELSEPMQKVKGVIESNLNKPIDEAEAELQDAITTPRPQEEIDKTINELREIEQVKDAQYASTQQPTQAVETKIDEGNINTPVKTETVTEGVQPYKSDINKIPEYVQRIEEPNITRATVDKPHGVYTSPANVESPHKGLGGDTFYWKTNPDANVLRIRVDTFKTNRGLVGESAGVGAARKLLGDEEVSRMMKLSKKVLSAELSKQYPKVEWNKYYDQQEMVEGIAGLEARKAGYDAIWAVDPTMPEMDEFVGLTDNALSQVESVPVASKTAQNDTQPTKTTMSERQVGTSGKDALISKRNVKAYMFENPEVKDLYQGAAKYILDYEFVPNENLMPATAIMTQLKADTGLKPAEIKDALERLVNNHGQENAAAAKRVELIIDDMLTNGFDMSDGVHIDPNDDYIKLKSAIEGREVKPAEKVDSDEFYDAFAKQDEKRVAKAYEPNVRRVPEQFKGTEPGDINYKPVKVGMQVQIVNDNVKGKTPKFEYADPELEAVHKKNKGISESTLMQKAKKGVEDALNMFKRPIGTLPYTKENAELYKDLVRLPKLRAMASDDTIRTIDAITKDMDKNSFDMFERKVFLDDLAEEVKLGSELPNKWTPEKVQSELVRLDNAMTDTVREAVDKRQKFWDEIKENYTKAMKDIGLDMSERFTRENYFRHQVLDYMEAKNSIVGTGRKLKTPANRGFTKARTGEYAGDINTDYLQAEFEVMAQMKHDTEIAKIIKNVDENYNIVDTIKANAKANGTENWHDEIPEGYTTWQPREGNVFYMSQPIGAEIVEQSLALRGIKLDSIKDPKLKVALEDIMNDLADQTSVLAMGGKRKEFVVKNEVAETLDNLAKATTTNTLARSSKKVQSLWKRWVTSLNPKSTIKYGIRNFTGDLDALIAGNPGAVKKIPKAAKELFDAMRNGKFTPELKSWYDKGGYQSLLYTQEISQVNKMKPFEKFRDLSVTEKVTRPLTSYAEATESMHNYREAINRYAAYLDYLDQLNSGKLKNYGASRPEIIDGIKGIEDKAFKLSNDLLGAYDEVSQAGQVMRNHLIPFYSWMEINMKRYKNLFKNAFTNKEVARTAGISASLIGKLGLKTAGKLISIFGMTAALAAWNQLKYPDLEETLPEDVREKPHIVLGQDKDGNTLYFSRIGSLNDFLEWFGLSTATQDVKDVMSGKMTTQEALIEMVKSPANKVAGSVTPAYKTLAELLTGQKLYPDITDPMPIRDKAQYAAQSFGIRDEFDILAGKPTRPYFQNFDKAVLYKADPKESAYYTILDARSKYKAKKGEESGSFFYTKKSNALYNYKLALRYGDEKAKEKYMKLYESYGGNAAQTIESVLTMSPYYGIRKDERAAFKASLTGKDKEQLELAEQYFMELLETELTSKRSLTDGTRAMIDIYKKTGETKQFPKVVSNEMTFNKKTYKLSNEEVAEFQERVNEAMYKKADELAKRKDFQKLTPEKQAEMMSNVLNQQVVLERIEWKNEKYK